MALTFVYGNSGNGKSEYMYRKIVDMARQAPYQHFFVVVPEQFTMSAQQSLVAHSLSGVILNIDVVSFERLAYRVFDELGVHRTVLEETGKSLILRRIVEENEKNLTFLKRDLAKMGYIAELKSVLSELMQYKISPKDLEDFLESLDETSSLRAKLSDILCIYRSFDEYLRGGYVTAERVLDLLCEVAPDSSLLRGSVLFFDGYTGFTPVQMNLIGRLMHLASDLFFTVTLDVREQLYAPVRMEDLFFMSRRMVAGLTEAARDASVKIAAPVMIGAHEKSRLSQNPVLSHLEQNLFRIPTQTYEDPCGEYLSMYSLASRREELTFAAAQIGKLVRERSYHYRDCAIVCSDVAEYEKYAKEVFSLYDIPGFVDTKQSVLSHPLTEVCRAVIDMAATDNAIESVFRYLRTGLCGFTPGETDRLENYCIEKGIRGSARWKRAFDKPMAQHGRLSRAEEDLAEELRDLNELRERFVDQTGEVCAVFRKKDASVRERTEALYQLLVDLGAEEQMREKTAEFEEKGDETAAALNRQIYKILIDLLDKMVDLIGDEVIPVDEYGQILEAGFEAAKVGAIPPGNDCVILGDIERTRLDNVKALFFLGVNDGQIPKKSQRMSILSAYDREVMGRHHMELAPGEREQMFLQRFYLYLTLTKPSDLLCLCCARMDGEGKAMRPSYLIGTLSHLFTGLSLTEIAPRGMLPLVSPKSSVEAYLNGLIESDEGNVTPVFRALHHWYMGQEYWREKIGRLFDAHFWVNETPALSGELARSLYGEILTNSVTRLEKFGSCAFAHFLEYGLKLAERGEFVFDSPDIGTLFHAVLERYGKLMDSETRFDWNSITEQEQDALLRRAMHETVGELADKPLEDSATNAYLLVRIYHILKRSIWAITEQIRRGDFIPGEYEQAFPGQIEPLLGPDGEETGEKTRTVGSVDRMDLCVEEDSVGVRVVDYKSSKTDLRLSNVFYGRQLQLPVYLNTAIELLKERYPDREIIPAGIFYFHLDDPVVENAGEEEETEKAILSALKPSGLLNSDPAVYERMDRNLKEEKTSDVLPVSLNNDGSVKASAKSAVSTEDFETISAYVSMVAQQAARRMLDGDISINPYKQGDKTGCDYCSFRGICGFDTKLAGYRYREERKLTEDEAKEKMRKAADET